MPTNIKIKIAELLHAISKLAPRNDDLAEAYLFDEAEKEVKRLAKSAWDKLEKAGKLRTNADLSDKGTHTLARSAHYILTLDASAPVKRFDADVLAKLLYEKHKIPMHKSKVYIEEAKVPSKPRLTYRIEEV